MEREIAIKALRDAGPDAFDQSTNNPIGNCGWVKKLDAALDDVFFDKKFEVPIRFNDVFGTPPRNKYQRDLKGVTVDVYDVLKAFNVTCPALQHLAKKALCAGLRGHKDLETDLNDILSSAQRAIELNKE